MNLDQEKIRSLKALLDTAREVVVVAHTHPDGDALGSTAALSLYLREQLGKQVTCILPDTPPENLDFLRAPSVPYLFNDKAPREAAATIQKADMIVLLDCNAFSRTEGLQKALEDSPAVKILIDHHLNPDSGSFRLVFSTPEISSASELLYWVLKAMVPENTPSGAFARTEPPRKLEISGDPGWSRSDAEEGVFSGTIGMSLMAGMTTDTNNFANSVYPSTFRMASELIAAGVDRDALLEKLYQSYRENRVRLMGYMQNEGLHLLEEGAAYMILTKEIQDRFNLKDGESEGLVNVPLTIRKVRLSVLLKEDGDHFRVSVRSKKGTSAQNLAQRFFHGGGHENAAGGKLFPGQDFTPGKADEFLRQTLKDYLR
ncbi:MAG: DHH family phosphoesterase [Bacteroidales bacterium]|nr:DHH family phosphoesterase [Bacteroidales bacterium]